MHGVQKRLHENRRLRRCGHSRAGSPGIFSRIGFCECVLREPEACFAGIETGAKGSRYFEHGFTVGAADGRRASAMLPAYCTAR